MDGDVVEQQVPSALVTHLKFGLLTAADIEKISVLPVNVGTDITNAKLGLPNEASECSTCGAKSAKDCDGHLGMLTLPKDICHPYNLSVIVKILNSICPSCKSNKKESRNKGSGRKPKMSNIASHQPMGCKYCAESSKKWYPQVKFKVSSRNSSGEIGSAIAVEVKVPKKLNDILPDGFWNFIEEDPDEEEISLNPSIRYLSPYQVYSLLKDIDPTMIVKLAPRLESLFLGCLPVTSNCSRVMEFSNGKKLVFDERTKAYKRLIDFKGQASELALRVRDFLSVSKLYTEKSSNTDVLSGLKWVKDVVLAKRTDNSFRMVVVGDPNVKLGEIGMPREICQKLIFPETLNEQNWEKLHDCCRLSILERGQFRARRKDDTIVLRNEDDLKIGDIVYRHLDEGDLLLLNRPPSIHQHSLIALSVRVLPMDSVVLLNPICCSPFRGDFDGDCFHGYIPQSIKSRVELQELVCIDRQLVNGQNGRNLISLCHDSLSAAHLLREKGEFLNKVEMQQLGMLCSRQLPYPAIVRATDHNPIWTGNQLLSMLLPVSFDYSSLSGVHISNGEIISAPGSSWLQDTDGNLFISLVKLYGSKAVDIIFTIQEVLLEWISMRGFSVSLSDLFVSCDSYTWDKMTEEVRSGLQEAKKGLKNVLSKQSVCDFKGVFRDLQSLIYRYSSKDNSMLAMVKAGSKGSLPKLAQQCLTLGLQYSNVPLSFSIPWDSSLSSSCHVAGVVESSFLAGLSPSECFLHSISCRDSSFSENADVPGTLNRKLMFSMRDLYMAYDGTVRYSYGNQVVQFSYGVSEDSSVLTSGNSAHQLGDPVGSLAACSISEAAYSALEKPISTFESSPLLNLKMLLDSSYKKTTVGQTVSLFLSKKLERWLYGPEYGALTVRSHLERVLFSDIVSSVMIIFSQQRSCRPHTSPWVCHFHLHQGKMKKIGLDVQSIINALHQECDSTRQTLKVELPKLHILTRICSATNAQNEKDEDICITVEAEVSRNSLLVMDTFRHTVIPFLLGTVIKGFMEFKKVDILWSESNISDKASRGELYMKVHLYEHCKSGTGWSLVVNKCLRIMDLIDWNRSHPDSMHDLFCTYGIDCSWEYFLRNLKVAVSDIGKSILPEHLLLVADCLTVTGQFIGLNAKGIAKQRDLVSVPSPFTQACFSSPGPCFIKAAKYGAEDGLLGVLNAAAWGKEVPLGTGGQFDIIYSGKVHEFSETLDIYNTLSGHLCPERQNVKISVPPTTQKWMSGKGDTDVLQTFDSFIGKGPNNLKGLSDLVMLHKNLQEILHRYPVNDFLNEKDKSILTSALSYHPRSKKKIGTGIEEIKVGTHQKYKYSHCFILVRKDGSEDDFSYRKCVRGFAKTLALPPWLKDKVCEALSTTCMDTL